MSVEIVPPPMIKEKPNGDRAVLESEVGKMLKKSGLEFVEVILDCEDSSRAFAIANEGHVPTKYELGQITSEDWNRIRDSVDLTGTQAFSERLTMLEEMRMTIVESQAG